MKVCFDSNHLLQEQGDSFILAVGDKIVTTHISDYDFVNERHLLPGELDIDWEEYMDLGSDYEGMQKILCEGESEVLPSAVRAGSGIRILRQGTSWCSMSLALRRC